MEGLGQHPLLKPGRATCPGAAGVCLWGGHMWICLYLCVHTCICMCLQVCVCFPCSCVYTCAHLCRSLCVVLMVIKGQMSRGKGKSDEAKVKQATGLFQTQAGPSSTWGGAVTTTLSGRTL